MKTVKIETPFVIYTTRACDEVSLVIVILQQYKDFQDVFEKKNVDILPKHRPYDCAIDL